MTRRLAAVLLVVATAAACGGVANPEATRATDTSTTTVSTTAPPVTTTEAPTTTSAPTTTPTTQPLVGAVAPPDWLGTRVLEATSHGYALAQPTPPELVDRRFITVDVLPPPTDATFTVSVSSVDDAVLARSTWTPQCPVARDELRYLTLPFWGFDGDLHTGELLVRVDAVEAVSAGFSALFEARFPIEEMRISTVADLDAPPTGDGNNTSAFVCRPSRGTTSWSQHAYGRAVDINPFHNPYTKGDVVLPELATAYLDRANSRPGMLDADAVRGFTDAGWVWGGNWNSLKDLMHVSASGT